MGEKIVLSDAAREELRIAADKIFSNIPFSSTREGYDWWHMVYTRLKELANVGELP